MSEKKLMTINDNAEDDYSRLTPNDKGRHSAVFHEERSVISFLKNNLDKENKKYINFLKEKRKRDSNVNFVKIRAEISFFS